MSTIAEIAGELFLGWLAADLITGIVHFWMDRFGNPAWPVLGPWLIEPNQLHHVDLLAFARHGFLARNLAAIVTACLVGAVLALIFGTSIFLAVIIVGTGLSNEIHRLAHQPSTASKLVRALQATGFLQSPKGHAGHHRPPNTTNFCVLSDWLNPLVEAIRARFKKGK